jgi:hypothetical protein
MPFHTEGGLGGLDALLGQQQQGPAGVPPELLQEFSQGPSPGDLPRQLIELTHQAIAVEPDAEDKAMLGQILRMLLAYQAKQAKQGQGGGT